MALASSVLMFAGSPQAFLGVASVQESLFLLMDILPVRKAAQGRTRASANRAFIFRGGAFYKIWSSPTRSKRREVISFQHSFRLERILSMARC